MSILDNSSFRMGEVRRTLLRLGDLYTLEELVERINDGRFQSFVEGETWIVTQMLQFPRKKVLDITFVFGCIGDVIAAAPRMEQFARENGASAVQANARLGFKPFLPNGWYARNCIYWKDLN